MTDLDRALREYAGRWNDAHDAAPDLDAALHRIRARQRRRWPVAVAAACVVVVAAALALALGRSTPRPAASPLPAGLAARALTAVRPVMHGAFTLAVVRTTPARAQRYLPTFVDSRPRNRTIWLVEARGDAQSASPARALITNGAYYVDLGGVFVGVLKPRSLAPLGRVFDLGSAVGTAPDYRGLRDLALRTARQNGEPHPVADAVRTTLRRAERALGADHTNRPDQPVWLIQLYGRFTVRDYHGPRGSTPPTGTCLTLIRSVDPARGGVLEFGVGNRLVDLGKLGPLVTLR